MVNIITCFILIIFALWISGKCLIKPYETYNNSMQETSIKSGTLEIDEPKNVGDPLNIKKKDSDGNYTNQYKISVIGDLHLNDDQNCLHKNFAIDCIDAFIKIEHPDIIILNGDTLDDNSSYQASTNLINMFERNNQYWTFTLGNHDGECFHLNEGLSYQESRAKAFKTLSGYNETAKTYVPHCLARVSKEPDLYGFNSVINLLNSSDNIVKSLILTDVNKQIDITPWYQNVIGNCGDSILFYHIPFNQYVYACNNIGKDKDIVYHFGTQREEMCDDRDTTSLWNAILNSGKTKDLVFSHDHNNMVSISYKGIRMTSSLGFSFGGGTRRLTVKLLRNFAYMIDCSICEYVEGATCFYLKTNETVLGNKYAQFNGTFDNLKGKLYVVCFGAITYNASGLTIFNRIIFPLATVGCLTYYGFLINYHVNEKKKKVNKTI